MGLTIHLAVHNTDPETTCHYHIGFPSFSSETFFLYLLPPIILESAYSLHDRAFFDNIGTVLIFAVFGTMLNVFIVGPGLYALSLAGAMGDFPLTISEALVFSSLVSAVDPVAVLNIFQELGVNKSLYFLVFGESLLNDGVTVVVYNNLVVFMGMENVKAVDIVLSITAFFVVSLVGAFIGLVYGLLTALVTRTTTTVRVIEPLALLGLAYLSYLTAELFHFSGIISLIVCGLVQDMYAFHNISSKSYTCVKYCTKMASAISETIIFMFLGMVFFSEDLAWNTGFVLWTLFLTPVVRFIITFGLAWATNRFRLRALGASEQFILAYGGLRGAVAFSLVTMLPDDLAIRDHFTTATLAVVVFTVFVQGISIKPLVTWLNVSRRTTGPKQLLEEVHESVVDSMMAGGEEGLGSHGDFYLRTQLRHYNEKYLKKIFVRSNYEAPLKRLFEKISVAEHYAHLYGPAVLIEQKEAGSTEMLLQEDNVQRLSSVLEDQADATSLTSWTGDDSSSPDTRGRGVRERPAFTLAEDKRALKRAISSNPYNQLHYTYNRNLVNEESQEIDQLRLRRSQQARRLSRLASQTSVVRRNSRLASREDVSHLPAKRNANSSPPRRHNVVWSGSDDSDGRGSRPLKKSWSRQTSQPPRSPLPTITTPPGSVEPEEYNTDLPDVRGMPADVAMDYRSLADVVRLHRHMSVVRRRQRQSSVSARSSSPPRSPSPVYEEVDERRGGGDGPAKTTSTVQVVQKKHPGR